MIEILIILS